jgi:hypothetical protein
MPVSEIEELKNRFGCCEAFDGKLLSKALRDYLLPLPTGF